MKKKVIFVKSLLAFTISFVLIQGVYAQSAFSSDFNIEDAEVGDFIEVTIEMDDGETTMDGNMRMEITDTDDQITVKGDQYDVLTMSTHGEGALSYYFGGDGDWTMDGKLYYDMNTEEVIKDTMTMKITYNYLGQTIVFIDEITNIYIDRTSTLPEGTEPTIGESWTETETIEKTETQTTKDPEGNEDSSTETTTETTEKDYTYLKDEEITVPAGTFMCRVVKYVDEDDEPGEYYLVYHDKDINQEVKYIKYDDYGTQTEEMELIAYEFKNLDESGGESVLDPIGSDGSTDETSMFNLGKIGGIDTFLLLILLIIVVVIIAGIIAARKRGEPKAKQALQQIEKPQAVPPHYAQYQQQQTMAQPQYAQQAPSSYQCPFCLQPLTYIQQYRRWYCFSCQRYQ